MKNETFYRNVFLCGIGVMCNKIVDWPQTIDALKSWLQCLSISPSSVASCCCCWLPNPFRGMGAWRKTMESQKPGNYPGSGPEVVQRQRVAKE